MSELNGTLIRTFRDRLSSSWRSGLKAACCIILTLFVYPGVAQPLYTAANNAAIEQHVKAASLYKFLSYVEWPATAFTKPDSPYVIGVIGAEVIEDDLLKIIVNRNVNNRPLTIKKLNVNDPLTGIHVLFIGQVGEAAQAQLLKQAQQRSILTVTETRDALAQGSMINFVISDNRVRFEVALDAVEKADLKLSSRMLSVARSVSRGAP
jgi:hypothetical protein